MPHAPTVFVVDSDEAVRAAIGALLGPAGVPVEGYAAAHDFLAAYDPARPGCVVLETRLPGMSGLQLQHQLAAQPQAPPVIFVTAYGDIAAAVQALRDGALDFMEKPLRPHVLLERIHEALEADAGARRARAGRAALEARVARLTPREREVMPCVAAGLPNKAIAARIGVGHKAIEAYRGRVMRKMEAHSVAELVRMSMALEQVAGSGNPCSWPGRAVAAAHDPAVRSRVARPSVDLLQQRPEPAGEVTRQEAC